MVRHGDGCAENIDDPLLNIVYLALCGSTIRNGQMRPLTNSSCAMHEIAYSKKLLLPEMDVAC